MSPLNKIIWINAFRKKATEVMLRDGRRFTIDYSQTPGKAWVNGTNGESAPCGWFDLARVTDDMFLQESDYGRTPVTISSVAATLGK
jgi:hypothetical protein